MDRGRLTYYGELKVPNGKYTDANGKEKTRYQSVGRIYHSPHMSRLSVKLYPTATSDERWLNAFPHDGYDKPSDNSDSAPRDDSAPHSFEGVPSFDDVPF